MEYELTAERIDYQNSDGKVVLNACPGSGKTTSIVKKIGSLLKTWDRVNSKYSGIACLSFTNAAKDELITKFYEINGDYLKYPHIFCTIDSFINRYITLPFFSIFYKDFPRPKIVDDDSIIEKALSIVYQKDGKDQIGIESPLNNFKDKAGLPLFRIYKVQDIWIEKDGSFSHNGKIPSSIIVDNSTFQNYGRNIFQKKIKKGLITSLDSSFIAMKLLTNYKRIGECLIKRFPSIIIDEAQDNSELQHDIFNRLIELGLNRIELVGDPYQSLYEWRHAKPHLFMEKFTNPNWAGLVFSENRRSNQRIIDCFSLIRSTKDAKISSRNVADLGIPITIYKYNENNKELIINDFATKCRNNSLLNNQIVVRGNVLKNRMLGNSVPIEPWKSEIPYTLLHALNLNELKNIRESINVLRKLSINLLNPTMNFKERKELDDQYSEDCNYNANLYKFLRLIPPISLTFQNWTLKSQILLKDFFNLSYTPNFDFKKKMDGFKMKVLLNQSIEMYYSKNVTQNGSIPITTIHKVKGKTLDSLLIFFNENSKGQNISFNDFNATDNFPTEKQRMIYVACSRPKQFLALAFPQKITDGLIQNRFGLNIQIINP